MEYYGEFYLEKLPDAFFEQRVVNGVSTRCLILPLSSKHYALSRYGHLLVQMKIKEDSLQGTNLTHRIFPHLATPQETGLWQSQQRSAEIGALFRQRPKEENNNRNNDMTEIKCYGAICLDEIPDEAIYIDRKTGKRMVRLVFEKTPQLDGYGNSHHIFINPKYGAKHGTAPSFADGITYPKSVIGSFREWRKEMRLTNMDSFDGIETDTKKEIEQINNNTNTNMPFQIDGYDF